MSSFLSVRLFFFFQAEDGIRDLTVTGVQTCALPISTALQSDVVTTIIWVDEARALGSAARAASARATIPPTVNSRETRKERGFTRPRMPEQGSPGQPFH